MDTIKELKEVIKEQGSSIKKRLPRGAVKKLAKQFKCSDIWVYKVLSGENFNLEIIKAAKKMGDEYQAELENMVNEIKQL